MGRRTSGQTVGLQTIGNIQASANTLTTTQTNQNLTIDPNGTGAVDVFASITINGDMSIANQGDLRLLEASGNGTNYIAMQAAASMAANYTLTWPAAVTGTAGFVLTSDISGNLSWASAGGNISIADPGSTATVHYPLFATNAGSLPTTLSPNARANLTFVPSTGVLSATELRATASTASSTVGTGAVVVTGGLGVGGQLTCTTLVETSSIAFKENVNPIENALGIIMQLVGVTYDRKDNNEHEAGLIAEEVYKIAPDLVSLDKNGKPYGIKYTKVVAYLIESVKSLSEDIAKSKLNK
jgi:hypothetical protein